MKFAHVIFFLVVLLNGPLPFAQEVSKLPFAIGDRVELKSTILNENRILNIYVPQGYSSDSSKTYPVIYLLDGSFDEDFIHISGLVQFCSFSWINIISETIVVGIENRDRQRDFTFPTQIEQHKQDYPTTGHSSEFIVFLENELIPFVDSNYKTSSEKTIIGQSLGGLLATEILFTKTSLFDNYFIISPSLWWNNESLLNQDVQLNLDGKSIYIAVGNEGKVMIADAKKLAKKVKSFSTSNTKVYYQYFKNKSHGDILHQAVYVGFEKIFKKDN